MVFGKLVKGGVFDLNIRAREGVLHVGHFFRSLIDQKDHDIQFRMVTHQCACDLFEDRGLADLRLGHDHAALTFADRGNEIDDPE